MAKYCKYYGLVLYLDCLECEEKYCRKGMIRIKNKIIIGIDQSYKDSGITLSMNGGIKSITDCYTANLKTNTEKRKVLKTKLDRVFTKAKMLSIKYDADVICIIERIRLRSDGFININYIKSIGALNALIVDAATEYHIPVYSVDTRAWKSSIVGTSKPKENKYGIDPKKYPTILWCIDKGFESSIKESVLNNKKKKGIIEKNGERFTYNDNKADSAAISLYGFISNPNLKEEH
jgi:hypothetical protein